jgi:hypothetical protein
VNGTREGCGRLLLRSSTRVPIMNAIIYLVGLVVIVLAIVNLVA